MSRTKTEVVARYEVAERSGLRHQVEVHAEFVETTSQMSGAAPRWERRRSVHIMDGRTEVRSNDDGSITVPSTGEAMLRI
jgi:hypothetical protein